MKKIMRLINTKLHGWIDYCYALLVICIPWLFGYNKQGIETLVPVATGAFVILYSLFTNYEMGLLKLSGIPMKLHLLLDVLTGVFLAAAPRIFSFNDITWLPFLFTGSGAVIIALTTDQVAYARLGPDAMKG